MPTGGKSNSRIATEAMTPTKGKEEHLFERLTPLAHARMDSDLASITAALILKLETEAGKSIRQDIEIASDLTTGVFRILSEQCMEVCKEPEEFLDQMRNGILRVSIAYIAETPFVGGVLEEIETAAAFFALRLNPWVGVPESEIHKHCGVFIARELSHLSLELGVKCRKRYEERLGRQKSEAVVHNGTRLHNVAPEVRSKVQSFLIRCNAISPDRILRTHLWKLAGHAQPRQFEYFQSGDARATDPDRQNFNRILDMEPGAFIELLRAKKLL